jgi:hypothetical protein
MGRIVYDSISKTENSPYGSTKTSSKSKLCRFGPRDELAPVVPVTPLESAQPVVVIQTGNLPSSSVQQHLDSTLVEVNNQRGNQHNSDQIYMEPTYAECVPTVYTVRDTYV